MSPLRQGRRCGKHASYRSIVGPRQLIASLSVSLTRKHRPRPFESNRRPGRSFPSAVHGRPVADIVPRQERSERRPTERFLADLAEIGALAAELDVESPSEDFDVGLTTDDMIA